MSICKRKKLVFGRVDETG